MKHSIYPFSAVLRAVPKGAKKSPEEAALLTSYPNYKRWESGKPVVKSEYLPPIADAFGSTTTCGSWPTPGSSTR